MATDNSRLARLAILCKQDKYTFSSLNLSFYSFSLEIPTSFITF